MKKQRNEVANSTGMNLGAVSSTGMVPEPGDSGCSNVVHELGASGAVQVRYASSAGSNGRSVLTDLAVAAVVVHIDVNVVEVSLLRIWT